MLLNHFLTSHLHPRGGGGGAVEGEYVFPVRRQEKRILPPPPRRRRRRGGGDGDGDGDEAGHSDGEVRKWFKNIGFLFPPVCSYKMSAWMRMFALLLLRSIKNYGQNVSLFDKRPAGSSTSRSGSWPTTPRPRRAGSSSSTTGSAPTATATSSPSAWRAAAASASASTWAAAPRS